MFRFFKLHPVHLSLFFFMMLIPAMGESNATTEKDANNSTINTELAVSSSNASKSLAYVIPIKDQIGPPILDILRRGLKDAIRDNAQLVILDMDTPGGELGVTLEIMEEIIESLETVSYTHLTLPTKRIV